MIFLLLRPRKQPKRDSAWSCDVPGSELDLSYQRSLVRQASYYFADGLQDTSSRVRVIAIRKARLLSTLEPSAALSHPSSTVAGGCRASGLTRFGVLNTVVEGGSSVRRDSICLRQEATDSCSATTLKYWIIQHYLCNVQATSHSSAGFYKPSIRR